LNVAKTDRRRQQIQAHFTNDNEIPGLGTPTIDILEHLYAEDVARMLERAVATLPERSRTAITLRWQQQMSYDQIASILGTTTAAVQMQVSRGIKILRELLKSFPE
jgi:RNA polymerase sigma factor (sigma-70 family)